MHDIDNTRLEVAPEYQEYQEYQESDATQPERLEEGEGDLEMPMSEAEEEALAAELLGVSSEAELDQFLGGLFRKISKGIKGAAGFLSRAAGPLAGALKGIARTALPALGTVLGTAIPIPGVGTALGASLGRAASSLLQSEMDHLEVEEREFQSARRFVQLATQAVRHASRLPGVSNPHAAANVALRRAVQRMRNAAATGARPVYRTVYRTVNRPCPPCPPPPPCPTCSQPLPGPAQPTSADLGGGDAPDYVDAGNPSENPTTEPGGDAPPGDAGSDLDIPGQGEGGFAEEYYETQPPPASRQNPGNARTGRWVRHGRTVILYGV